MKNNEKNPNQIIRKDGRDCFVEVLNDSFEIGKIHMRFIKYDTSRPSGSRSTNQVDIYIDASEFLVLAHEALFGILYNKVVQAAAENKPGFRVMGGTSVKRLAARDKARTDGKSLSRIFDITQSNKGYFLTAKSGPGEEDAKGLIVPKFGNNPENSVSVPIAPNDFNEMVLITKEHYNAWLTTQYAKGELTTERRDPDAA